MEVNIRQATPDDLDAIFELNLQINALHFANAPEAFVAPSEDDRAFLTQALENDERLFLVAEHEKEVVGFLTAMITQNETVSFLIKDPICRVGTIVVDGEQKQQGIGRQLLEACEQWARDANATQVRLEVMEFNQPAQRFYDKQGFKTNSRIMLKHL
ncbi:TPA: N-acetyltransferase family protein [Vibrio diabolicus]|uniref:GNAT family N-acetyltransferase n=1 Tax=Vibrio diabolicus TaxID=50719 RepID=UPI0021609E95|nr:GNAT family N-acetyltransferase [Vibrio diabolicus]MCS0455747.1 GNAT family N-acetyltransferase [Vibrio diabolicus]